MKVKKVRKLIYAEYICGNLFPVNTVILTLENGNQIAYFVLSYKEKMASNPCR